MKRLLLPLLIALPAQADLTLSKDGQTTYTIVATPAELQAAKELQSTLHQVTGATFPISDTLPANSPAIVLKSTPGPTDSIQIHTDKNHLTISGTGPRGTLYAAYTFLEDTVGVRWWTSSESTTPHKPTLIIPDLDLNYTPALQYRECYNADVMRALPNASFAAHLKLNGNHQPIPPELGGHYTLIGWCHTSFNLMPPATYFAKHPDWYAEVKGKRQTSQLCWSNPDMRAELARNVLAQIRKNPAAGMISVSQQDAFGQCHCPLCRAIVKEDGTDAGPLLRGVNAVAAEVAKEYPDFLVETLAYQWSRKPPKVTRPAKNVLMRLCSIEADFSHPLESQDFGRDLKDWSAIADHLFVWNYVTNFSNYLIPQPNLTPIGPDLKFFAAHHVVGVFEQGDAFNSPIGDFLQLRVWLQSHLLWNSSLDQRALTQEFLDGYYGPASADLLAYLDLINAPAADPNFRRRCYHAQPDFFTPASLAEATRLFDHAESAVAGQPEFLNRVKLQRLILDHVRLMRYDFAGQLKHKPAEQVAADFDIAANSFIQSAYSAGARNFSEGLGFNGYVGTLRATPLRAIPPTLPIAGGKLPPGSFDIQQDQFYLYQKGTLSDLVDDPKASDGKSARMPGGHTEWAIQFHIPKDAPYAAKGPWQCFVVARCEAKSKSGNAFTIGVHDMQTHAAAVQHDAPAADADGSYHTYGFVLDDLHAGQYFWLSAAGADAVYLDRIFIRKLPH